jgi:hypothetical protein
VRTLDGSTWTELVTDTADHQPGPQLFSGGQTAAYDPDRGRIVVFGDDGENNIDAVWTLARTASVATPDLWTQLCDGCTGIERGGASLVYLPDFDQTFLFGGRTTSNTTVPGTWLVEPSSKQIDDANLPARENVGAVYDPSRDVVVIYGGDAADGDDCQGLPCAETWELIRD